MPFLHMMYQGPQNPKRQAPEAVAHAARIGAELGADIIKANYTRRPRNLQGVIKAALFQLSSQEGPNANHSKKSCKQRLML
jgi:DhnA family fructose-bisphosphate aldolase class Ia